MIVKAMAECKLAMSETMKAFFLTL